MNADQNIVLIVLYIFFFFSSRRRHTRSKRDWSSDVCSSDLDTAELTYEFNRQFQFDQHRHLTVAILFDDVDAVMLFKKFRQVLRKRHGAQTVVAYACVVFTLKLIERFDNGPVRRAKCQKTNIRAVRILDLRLRNLLSSRFVFFIEPVHITFVIVGTLAIYGIFVVAASTSEVRRRRMVRAG